MRSPQQMMQAIMALAADDGNVRAVWMNGSRANPDIAPDPFQDFDIVFAVRDTAPFLADTGWIDALGKIAVMQRPDDSALFPNTRPNSETYAFLIQFWDGNRIDLTLVRADLAVAHHQSDALVVPLLDKDGALPPEQPPSDKDYYVKAPSAREFADCCNEFFWVAPYVAKGVRRGEVSFAMTHLNVYMRDMLDYMIGWYAAMDRDFNISVGKNGKLLQRYLPADIYEAWLATYFVAGAADIAAALDGMTALFARLARAVASRMGFDYDEAQQAGSAHIVDWYLGRE